MDSKNERRYLTCAAAALAFLALGTTAGAEDAPRCFTVGGVLSSGRETTVTLSCEGEDLLGSEAVLRAEAGSGTSVTVDGEEHACPWTFGFDRESVRATLYDENGSYYFEPVYTEDEGRQLVLASPDGDKGRILVTVDGDSGTAELVFDMDMSSCDRCDVTVLMRLGAEGLPVPGGEGLLSGLWPLKEAVWLSDGTQTAFTLTETGFLTLPAKVIARAGSGSYPAGEGDAAFDVTDSAGNTVRTLCGGEGSAVLEMDAGYPFEAGESVFTVSEEVISPYLTAQDEVYTVRVSGGRIEREIDGYSGTREILVTDRDGTLLAEGRQRAAFTWDYEGRMNVRVPEDDTPEIFFVNDYLASGEYAVTGRVSVPSRYAPARAGEFTLVLTEDGREISRTQTTSGGSFAFDPITYTDADIGEKHYAVSQVKGDAAGIIYDENEYPVLVTVADAGEGVLTVFQAEQVVLVNGYTAAGLLELPVSTVFTGRRLMSGELSYGLYQGQDLVAEAQADAGGNAVLRMEYDLDDVRQGKGAGQRTNTIAYTVRLVTPDDALPGVRTDRGGVIVRVTLTEKSNGTIECTYLPESDNIVFTHAYSASGTVDVVGTVSFSDGEMYEGQFSFVIREGDKPVATAVNGEDGSIVFSPVKYDQNDVGHHTLTVSQFTAKTDSVRLDDRTYTLDVTVKDNGDGTLATSYIVTDSPDGRVGFENGYRAEGKFSPVAVMSLAGRPIGEGEFKFLLLSGPDTIAEAWADPSGRIVFDTVAYTQADTGLHDYTVRAVVPEGKHITCARTDISLPVVVSDTGTGILTVMRTGPIPSFGFFYTAEGSYSPRAYVTLNGRDIRSGEMVFNLIEDNVVVSTGTADTNGDVRFEPVIYTQKDIGTHFYACVQSQTVSDGVARDRIAYPVTVHVSDNGDGTLRVEPLGDADMEFICTYEASGTFRPLARVLFRNGAMEEGMFTFELVEHEKVVRTQQNGADGLIAFSEITYTEADVGRHAYAVRQTGADRDGIVLDTASYEMIVDVTDNGDGTLTVQRLSGDIRFDNAYHTVGTAYLSGKVVLSGRKLNAGEFAFDVKCGDRLITSGVNGADGAIRFSDMVFTEDDLLTMNGRLISDNSLDLEVTMQPVRADAGLTGDDTVYTFRVGLKDLGNGTMAVSGTEGADNILFRASYASSGEAVICGRVETADYSPAEGDFTFTLYRDGEALSTAVNGPDGTFSFRPVTFTERDKGDHAYTVVQQAGSLPGMIYDTAVRDVVVEAKDDGLGHMHCQVKGEGPVFENRQGRIGAMTVSADVKLTGRALEEGEIPFVLTEDGEEIAEGRNDADGRVSFALDFDAGDEGVHTYAVSAAALPDGVAAASGRAERTVLVAADGAGRMSWRTESETSEPFGFSYSAQGTFSVTGRCELSGRDMTDGMFTFALTGADGSVREAECGADGRFVFDPVSFTEADVGEWACTVAQTGEVREGYTLDGRTFSLTLRVEDAGDGTLNISQSAEPVFENAYLADGEAVLAVRTVLAGRDIIDGEFGYILEENGTEIARGVTDASGCLAFAGITYTQADAGVHTYTVRPAGGTDPSLTLEGEDTVTCEVTVTDPGSGCLEVSLPGEAVFSYAYTASGTGTFGVRAVMEGRSLRAGEIAYVLKEGEQVIAEASVDETGLALFPEIRYSEGGPEERTYTASVSGALPGGVSGDGSVTFTVRITDDLRGSLTAEADREMPAELAYVYAPTGQVQIACTVVSTHLPLEEGDCVLVLTDDMGNQLSAVNESDGTVLFPPITYALSDVGEHTCLISQEKGARGGMVYDGEAREVKVTVTEEENGTLSCTADASPVFVNGYAARGEYVPEARIECTGFTPSAGEIVLALTRDGDTVCEGTNSTEGLVTFPALSFTDADAGTHTYRIYASSERYSGMTSPEEGIGMEIAVRDEGDGTLSFTKDGETVIPLTYLSAGHARVDVKVTLEGRAMNDSEFAFALVENDDVISTARADRNGNAGFDIFYENGDAGEHTYEVMQLDTGLKSVRLQSRRYTVRVNVTDPGTGELRTEVICPEGGVTFANVYEAKGEVKITGKVILTGKDLKEREFMLSLYRDGVNILSALCDGNGDVVFDSLPLTEKDAGVMELTLSQDPGNEAGIVYDETAYTILVTVTDDGEGNIRAEYAGVPAFRNTYEASGRVVITSEVNLVGRMLSEDSFTLTMTENGRVLQEKTNDAEGVVTFDPIVYGIGDIGTHIYEISETATGEAGVPLSSEKQIVKVTVSDVGGGVLKTDVTGNGYAFRNSFTATAVLSIRAKLVENGMRTGEAPRMILRDAEGNVIEEITAVEGVNVFSQIAFTQSDAGKKFVYTVSCTDVESVYTVEARVSDGLDGSLSVSETIIGSEGVTDGIRFLVEHAMALSVTVNGAREAIACTVVLKADGVELKGDYPVTGAAESTISSGGRLTIRPDSTAVISSLPSETEYSVSPGTLNRYTVSAANAEGILTDNLECVLDCTFRTTDFRFRAELTDEDGVTSAVPADTAQWTLYADGKATGTRLEADGNEFAALGLPYADTTGKIIEYSARAETPDEITVTYINTGVNTDNTDEVFSGGEVQMRAGLLFSVRVRFTEGGEEPVYTYRTVSAVLYNDDGRVGDVTLTPDESGWCRIGGLEVGKEYYVVLSGVNGYTSSNRNVGKYGNVTRTLYDGGTATFTAAPKGAPSGSAALYAGAGAGALGLAGVGAYLLMRRRRRH